ncbi:FecR domain-containing protein [Sulfurimonas sp. HSL1-6]|uniref:FecR family protein n=1 Tax=Thiomicrolovo immobilis TaxID=3131935 RepID=UPI0031F8B06F
MKQILLLCLISITLWSAESVAVLDNLKNEVGIRRGGDVITPSGSGEELYRGDIIFTGSDGALSILFNDGSTVALGNKSVLKIDDYLFEPSQKKYRFDLFLKEGSAIVETGKIGKVSPKSVTFRVPEGTIGVRGTRFFVKVH